MNITFITTVNHNVGDDFVREGIKFLLEKKFPNDKIHYSYIHKHIPLTARNGFDKYRNRYLSFLIDKLPVIKSNDKIHNADLVIQSGAPIYWCHPVAHCSQNEWFTPLIERRLLKSKTKFANIAGGACQQYFSDGSEFNSCENDKSYIKKLFEISSLTTLRDVLAKKILNSAGCDAEVLPCTSIFAADYYSIAPTEPDFIAMNYMNLGGHYDFAKNVDTNKWKNTFIKLYNELSKNHKIKIICHDKQELADIKNILPDSDIFYSDNFVDYLKIYSHALVSVVNRIHGLFAAASFGAPGIAIANDSRALMTREIALETVHVNDAGFDFLLDKTRQLIQNRETYKQQICKIKEVALNGYLKLFDNLFS